MHSRSRAATTRPSLNIRATAHNITGSLRLACKNVYYINDIQFACACVYVDFEFFRRKAYEILYIYVYKWPSSHELKFSDSFRENVYAYLHMFKKLDNMYRQRIFP